MDRAAPLNSRKAAPVKTGTVARRGARVHQEYRQVSVLAAKSRRRGDPRAGPRRSVEGEERISSPRYSLDPRASRSMPLLRTGAIPVAFLRRSAGHSVSESLRRKGECM